MRCIVRPRQNPADFLRDWGATTVQADLNDPTSLPAALVRHCSWGLCKAVQA